jgi:glutathione S-transferase
LAHGVLRLYDHPASGNCFKARLLLAHLDEPYERVLVDIFAGEALEPEHRGRNPAGRVPVLELDDGTFIAESGAILLFLSEGSEYLPGDRLERARVWQWLFFEQNQIEPSVATARVMQWRGREAERPDAYEHRTAWANEALDSLEAHLAGNDFLLGDAYTVADMALYGYTHVAHEVVDMDGRRAIAAWIGRVEAQPRFMNDLKALP